MWSVLLSSLRPARRHASELTTVLGSKKLIGSRAYASSSINGDSTRHKKKRDLYVVLDDHKDGFGIHKLDLSFYMHDLDGDIRRLPRPPIFRVTLETLGSRVQFAAVGSSIVATGTTLISPVLYDRWLPSDIGGVLIYNTKTAALTVTPHLPDGLTHDGYRSAIAIGNSLYMLGSVPPFSGNLHCLTADPVGTTDGNKFWGWEPLSDTSSWCWSNFYNPPVLPFFAKHITAYAVSASPPGPMAQHEILVSLRPTKRSVLGSTFSFRRESNKWTQLHQWHLPVVGHAHYDSELDAWVGLHAVSGRKMYGPLVMDGHLCVGKVTSAPPEWKVSTEKLFRLEENVTAGWRHVDVKLVPRLLGKGGNEYCYCLMERLCPNEEEEENQKEDEEEDDKVHNYNKYNDEENVWGEGSKCLLRLAFFRVKRGEDGELMVTAHRPVRYYEICRHNKHFDAQAFWI